LGTCWGRHWGFEEHVGGIHSELGIHVGNPVGTSWKHIGNNKHVKYLTALPQPIPTPFKNNIRPLGCMLAHLIGSQKFLCLPLFFTIFGPG